MEEGPEMGEDRDGRGVNMQRRESGRLSGILEKRL